MDSELGYVGPVVVFDLDDTLYKERDYMASALHEVAHRISMRQSSTSASELYDAMWHAFCNSENPFDALAPILGDAYSEDLERRCVQIYREHFPDIHLTDDVQDMLNELSGRGYRLAIITDGRVLTQSNKIEALGLNKYFSADNIFISEQTSVSKKELAAWQPLVRKYVNASVFIYVGDNPAKDFEMPSLLGWHTIGLRSDGGNIHEQNHGYQPHVWVQNITEMHAKVIEACENKFVIARADR